MRKIKPCNTHACQEHFRDYLRRFRSRPDRTDEFGKAISAHKEVLCLKMLIKTDQQIANLLKKTCFKTVEEYKTPAVLPD
jgi:hypothetical protein